MAQAPRKTAQDFDPRILEIFDGYVHGTLSKREFITQAGRYAAAGVTGAMLLDQLQPNYALAQQVAADDPAIETARVTYNSAQGNGAITGLMARPAGAAGKLPSILVVHENRGLNPYIEDVVRRCAKAGYLAFGPDATLAMPRLILPSLQVNMRAGHMPPADEQGNVYLKLPVNKL